MSPSLVLFLGLVVCETVIWRRASRDGRDPAGAATLAAVAALAIFSPLFSLQVAAWLLPFAALAFDGDEGERHTAGVATVAVILTGLIAVVWRDQSAAPTAWIGWLVLARNLVWIDIVVSWLRVRPLRVEPPTPTDRPLQRASDTAADGSLDAVLPFDAE